MPGIPEHADILQIYGLEHEDSYDNVFEKNFIMDSNAQLVYISSWPGVNIGNWIFKNNVYYDVNWEGQMSARMDWYNNTFYLCSRVNQAHALLFNYRPGTYGSADNSELRNNVFLMCGRHPSQSIFGWYDADSNVQNFSADYDFVAGKNYASKRSSDCTNGARTKNNFCEPHGINGGDPELQNINDPIGPDGIAFTSDDGLISLEGSILCNSGQGGTYIGAYPCKGSTPIVDPQGRQSPDDDLDGVPNAMDRCPKTAVTAKNYVNVFGCSLPIAAKFDIKPDFNAIDINGLNNLELGVFGAGKISYASKITLVKISARGDERLDIDTDLNITQSKISLNQTSLPQLSAAATITFYNTNFTNPKILKDGKECTQCSIASYDRAAKTITFSVPGF